MNILIVKLSAVGDVVHTLPSLASLRRLYPDANISWVIEEASSDIICGHPYLDRVIVSRRKKWIADLKKFRHISRTILEIRSFIAEIRDRKYDLVIDFHGLLKSALIVLISSGKRKLGYDSMQELSGLFLNEKIFEDMGKHAVDRYLDFPRYLGARIEKPEFCIPVAEENKTKVKKLLRANGIDTGERFVAVNPIAFWETKLWDEKKFALLCDRISNELKLKVIFTGGTSEGAIERMQSSMTCPYVDLVGATTLRDLAYLYGLSLLVVTTDSGPMHVAAAVGTPTVAIFGPTDPARTGPYGANHTIVRKDLPCSPCFLKKCATGKCMKEISADEVFEAVRKAMNSENGDADEKD